jgi:mono/diheme cytochrome c family protein
MDQKLKLVFGVACAFLCGLSPSNQAFGQTLPEGKGKAEFVHNCTACHRADMVTAVKKTPADWRKSVDEMAARGTDGTKEDLDNVVLYLDKYYALDKAAPAETKQSTTPPSTSGSSAALNPSEIERAKRVIAENGCLDCHRVEQHGAYTGPSLNGVGTRHTADEIRAAIVNHHPTSGSGGTKPTSSYERKITGEDLDDMARFLLSLPLDPQSPEKPTSR